MISPGIIFDDTNNYSIVKTETVIGFGQKRNSFMNINSSEPFEWLITHGDFGRSFKEISTERPKQQNSRSKKSLGKGHKKKHSKLKKCLIKLLKKKKRKSKHIHTMMKKYLVPLIIGLIAAKSILIPVAFKTLALISVKALIFLSILKLLK